MLISFWFFASSHDVQHPKPRMEPSCVFLFVRCVQSGSRKGLVRTDSRSHFTPALWLRMVIWLFADLSHLPPPPPHLSLAVFHLSSLHMTLRSERWSGLPVLCTRPARCAASRWLRGTSRGPSSRVRPRHRGCPWRFSFVCSNCSPHVCRVTTTVLISHDLSCESASLPVTVSVKIDLTSSCIFSLADVCSAVCAAAAAVCTSLWTIV